MLVKDEGILTRRGEAVPCNVRDVLVYAAKSR